MSFSLTKEIWGHALKRKRLIKSEITEDLPAKKTMQTLTAGSFLNLENDSIVEALKHTARRLAEASATVVKENLPPAALENLANTLWGKAAYVTRETERRRLHQIFVENFNERFRELKSAAVQAGNSNLEFSPAAAPVENAGSKENLSAPTIVQSAGSGSMMETRENISSTVSPKESAPAAEEKTDEFLGFVEPGESFKDEQAKEINAAPATATVPEKSAPPAIQSADELDAETSKPKNQTFDAAAPISTIQSVAEKVESPAVDTSHHAKPEATTAAAPENNPMTTAAATVNAAKADGEEPFEFEKCTINLNLTLLPMESETSARKVIVGAVSHNLPPEIDFLEIDRGGADLTNIGALVKDKLARFKQTLPVKYIEQLRQSKNKSAKKTAPAKTTAATAAAPTKPEVNQPKAEKTSGEQKVPEAKLNETAQTQSEKASEKGDAAISPATVPAANQSFGANSIQGSLF